MKIKEGRFVTQILYRGQDSTFALGWIGVFEKGGVTKKGGFKKTYKSTANGKTWSKTWTTSSGAMRQLLEHHGLDTMWGTYHTIPIPQTFYKTWKELDYNELYDTTRLRSDMVQEESSDEESSDSD